jgi:hypothetical protein
VIKPIATPLSFASYIASVAMIPTFNGVVSSVNPLCKAFCVCFSYGSECPIMMLSRTLLIIGVTAIPL